MGPLTPLFDLLGFNTLNETFFPPSSLFYGLHQICIVVVVVIFRRRDKRSKGRTILVERERERTLGEWEGDSRTKEGGGHEVWESKE